MCGGKKVSKVKNLHRKWLKNGEYRLAFKTLAPEFELAWRQLFRSQPREERSKSLSSSMNSLTSLKSR